jgi:hypothetical protein
LGDERLIQAWKTRADESVRLGLPLLVGLLQGGDDGGDFGFSGAGTTLYAFLARATMEAPLPVRPRQPLRFRPALFGVHIDNPIQTRATNARITSTSLKVGLSSGVTLHRTLCLGILGKAV